MASPPIDRLLAQLQITGLAIKDPALFQVIDLIIKWMRILQQQIEALSGASSSSGGGGSNTIINQILTPFGELIEERTEFMIPGPIGPTGLIGPMGPPGFDIYCEQEEAAPQISMNGFKDVGNFGIHGVSPGNPTGTTSTAAKVMMGVGGTVFFTPIRSGKVLTIAVMNASNNTINDGLNCQLRSGTGTAPANGDALTGTQRSADKTWTSLAANAETEIVHCSLANLPIGTTTWFDVALAAVTGGTAVVFGITFFFVELP